MEHNLKDYAIFKLTRYNAGDKGALGDLYEAIIKSVIAKRFNYSNVKVAPIGKADFYSRQGAFEIGHNGKQWNFRDAYDRQRHPRKVVYGMLTVEEFQAVIELIVNDNLTEAQSYVSSKSAIFSSEEEYIEVMDGLTRGKGLKTVLTKDRGELTMTIYNDSKRKAFLKALADGTLTKFEGRA